ncbi:MAG TPA: single-stranded-DNA-specific exonuclease RecJ [Candidatus Paceibacterota bacterium]|nr:single-stranded-DNA-specific exonuclease RecJ [Candidatus Paceibacterota bacterium]
MKNDLLNLLLTKRNIISEDDKEQFLYPDFDKHTHDPFLMPGMQKAVDRIGQAIKGDEHIVVYSDYDADGIPGGVVLHDFFKKIGYTNFSNYIPHRHDEGFGLNSDAIKQFAEKGARLIITIDCGITDVDEVREANENGMDVIVTDHHLPHDVLPDAHAIVNPKLKGSQYPFKELCGAGVIYKVVDGIIKSRSIESVNNSLKPGHEKWLLDMVGIATLSDMVPLTGENRVFATYGLKVLRKTGRPGLLKLFSKLRMQQSTLTEDDIAFMITPKINAASRMAHPMDAFNMLASDDPTVAGVAAEYLLKINDQRKIIGAQLTREITKREEEFINDPIVVIGNPDWKPGVLGLMANALSEKVGKSVFLWGKEDSPHYKGSVRATRNENIVEIMNIAHEEDPFLFDAFGGHAASGGFSVTHEKIHGLKDALIKAYTKYQSQKVKDATMSGVVEVCDCELELHDVSNDLVRMLSQLSPYGMDNPKPVFRISSAKVVGVKKFGKAKEHIELRIQNNEVVLKCIEFYPKDVVFDSLGVGDTVEMLGFIEESFFGGREIRMRMQRVRKIV